MEFLKKHATKKKIFLSALIYSGIYTVLCLISSLMDSSASSTSYDSMESILMTIASMITIVQVIFYAMLVIAVIIAVLAAIYFFKKDKSDYVMLIEFVGYVISSALLLFSMSGINAMCKVIRVYTSGDYSSYLSMDYTSMMSSIETAVDCMNYFKWVMIIMFVINLVVFLIIKNVIKLNAFSYNLGESSGSVGGGRIVSYDPQTGEPIYENTSTTQTTNSGETVANMKAFFKTKNGKIVVGVIALVIIAFGGYKIYDTYFNKTAISLLENVEVEFTGYDGAGRISSCSMGDVEYDKTDAELTSFVNSVSLDYENTGELKNGDEVTINAVYNQTTAEQLKLDVQDATVTVKVKGLTERYTKASKVPSKTSSAIKKLMDEEMKKDYDERTSSYYSYTTSFVAMYYAYDEEDASYPNDYCIGVYKVDQTSTFGATTETETYYAIAYVSGINSSFSSDEVGTINTTNLYGSGYQKLTDESQIQSAIEDSYRFSDHKISKFS